MAVKVAFLGNFRVPHTSENDYLWTMREQLGFEVATLQENQVSAEVIEATARFADVFFWVHTHNWETPGIEGVLARLKEHGVPTVAYHLDLYREFGRWEAYRDHPYFSVEHFFTVDKLMADWLNESTKTKGHFLRPGVVERDCALVEQPRPRKVIFVGSYSYHAEWPYRPKLIDWLRRIYGKDFELWGPQGNGIIRGEALNQLYAETKVVIGDTFCPDFKYPYYTSDRAYEVLGRGGFLIHPRIKGMDEELKDKEHLVYYDYNDFFTLRRLIDHYIGANEERETIRVAGHEKVKSDCTYTNRLREMFTEIGAL